MQPPTQFNQSGICVTCSRHTSRGMTASNGLVVCASCFQQGQQFQRQTQQRRQESDGIERIVLDPSLQDACMSVPFHSLGGLRITADDGRVFEGPAYQWCNVAWRAQQAGVTCGKVQAIPWIYR